MIGDADPQMCTMRIGERRAESDAIDPIARGHRVAGELFAGRVSVERQVGDDRECRRIDAAVGIRGADHDLVERPRTEARTRRAHRDRGAEVVEEPAVR